MIDIDSKKIRDRLTQYAWDWHYEQKAKRSKKMKTNANIEVYQDKAGEWRWKLVHTNGNIMADSSEGYSSKAALLKALTNVRVYMETAIIKEDRG